MINLEELNLTKNYLFKKEINSELKSVKDDFVVSEINIQNESVEDSHFSKEVKGIMLCDDYFDNNKTSKIKQLIQLEENFLIK